MGIHDEVGRDAHVVERKVHLGNDQAAHPLLSVARRELVPQLWATDLARHDLDQKLLVLVRRYQDPVDV